MLGNLYDDVVGLRLLATKFGIFAMQVRCAY